MVPPSVARCRSRYRTTPSPARATVINVSSVVPMSRPALSRQFSRRDMPQPPLTRGSVARECRPPGRGTPPQCCTEDSPSGAARRQSRNQANDLRSQQICDRQGDMLPEERPPGECPLMGRWSRCPAARRAVIPRKGEIARAPLLLEPVGAAAGCAPSEVEERESLLRGAFHEGPVQEHVCVDVVVCLQRGDPGHL